MTETAAGRGESARIAFFSPIKANSYIEGINRGIAKAVKDAGGKLTVYDANGNPSTQISQIQTAASSGNFDGFLVTSFDGSVVPAITSAVKNNGLKAVCIYSVCGPDQAKATNQMPGVLTSQVVVSSVEEGQAFAQATKMACEDIDPCEVAYIPGILAVAITRVRLDAFLEGVKDAPNIKIVSSEQAGDNNVGKSLNVAQNILTAHPNVDVMVGDDQAALGIQKALEVSGKMGKIKIVGGSGSQIGIDRVAQGTWFADASPEFPATYGELGTKALLAALSGEEPEPVIDANKIVDKPRVVTRDNAEQFQPAEWSGN